jgi:hypothetical protein
MNRLPVIASVVAAFLLSIHASAALIEVDLADPGDGLLTRDTDTGLDWLDLTLTFNLSYDEVAADIGVGLPAGFRHATQSEVVALFATGGVSVPTNADFGAYPNAIALMDLLGCTGYQCGTTLEFITGTMDLDVFDPLYSITLLVLVNHIQSNVNATILSSEPKNASSGDAGHYLVRAIPEPGTAALFGIGIVCVAVSRRSAR